MKRLEEYISEIYSPSEFAAVKRRWKQRLVDLEIVSSTNEFLHQCETETKFLKRAGKHRLSEWEEGWNGSGVTNEYADFPNIPFYFKKNKFVRIGEKVYHDRSGLTELVLLRTIQDVALSFPLIKNANCLIEYGAGTGHNLIYISELSSLTLYGADWAESAVNRLVDNGVVEPGRAFQVDYFNPSTYQCPETPFVAYTNASLEQTGDQYIDFMNFLFDSPNCVAGMHIEPISDYINPSSALNRFSIMYADRRGYLKNFYRFMQDSSVEIVHVRDYGLGSTYISGYQLLIWKK